MSFLPQDYETPKQNNHYMKLEEGENKIRILSRPILGWEDWKDTKPIRFKYKDRPEKPINPEKPIRHFWSFIVYNYANQEIQILHVTQSSIKKAIEALCADSEWGSPHQYDLKITKSGEGMKTEYSINPSPHKPITDEMRKKFKERKCHLEALFTNEDPFASHWKEYTPIIDEDVRDVKDAPLEQLITLEQFVALDEYLMDNEELTNNIKKYLKDRFGHENINEMPFSCYEGFLKKAKESFNSRDLFSK